ncbi:MAG: hypothetical protein ABSB42_11915 [Tepidisphaeraceae bacterium]|jgi:hypothetical protein
MQKTVVAPQSSFFGTALGGKSWCGKMMAQAEGSLMGKSFGIILALVLGMGMLILIGGTLYLRHEQEVPKPSVTAQQPRHIIHVPEQDSRFSDPIPSMPVMVGILIVLGVGAYLVGVALSKPRWHQETRPDGVWVRESVSWFIWF